MRSSPTVPPSSPAPGPSTVARDALRQHALDQGIAAVDLPGVGVTDRRVRLDGAYNFRDIGGLVGADGRRVRTGRVYRSDHLNDLSDADLGVIGALGLRAIHDFRLDSEVERQPSRLPTDPPIDVIRCPTGDVPGDTSAVDVVREHRLAGRQHEQVVLVPEVRRWHRPQPGQDVPDHVHCGGVARNVAGRAADHVDGRIGRQSARLALHLAVEAEVVDRS